MSIKYCAICQNKAEKCFKNEILKKYNVDYFFCKNCGFLQTEKPYWLEDAYSDVIATADTGLVRRNIAISQRLSMLLYSIFGNNGSYLDIAGGTGLLVRMMRDIGFDFYWMDPYCRNVHARGFEFDNNISPCNSVTAFEVLEHVEDPILFVTDALNKAKTNTFIFTTELYSGTPPPPNAWWYYTSETGQHISFYQAKTFNVIAERLGLNFYSAHGIHMLTDQSVSKMLFNLLTSRLSKPVALYVRSRMQSRTQSDHDILISKTSEIDG